MREFRPRIAVAGVDGSVDGCVDSGSTLLAGPAPARTGFSHEIRARLPAPHVEQHWGWVRVVGLGQHAFQERAGAGPANFE
jgi:hypothetical protein